MLKIFLSSHGHLASGMKSSLDILLGNSDRVTAFDAYVDQTNLKDVLEDFYKTVGEEDQVLLCSDLYGGSVNQLMYTFLTKPNTRLVAGVNLAFLLETASRESLSDDELAQITAQAGSMLRMVELEKASESSTETEEDFF